MPGFVFPGMDRARAKVSWEPVSPSKGLAQRPRQGAFDE